jgi:hypothetical protein
MNNEWKEGIGDRLIKKRNKKGGGDSLLKKVAQNLT